MSALPRGLCPICGSDVAIRRGGQLREHRVYLPQREQDPSTHLGRTGVCPGSGGPTKEEPVAIDTAPGTAPTPEEAAEPQEATDGLDETPEPEAEAEASDESEKVSRLGDPRRAVVDIIGKRLEQMLQPVDIAPEWTGVLVITRKDLGEALLAPLPPASIFSASVQTPAFIYVDAVCPVCGIAGEILLEITAVLTVEAYSRKLKLKAKASDLPHVCGQQRLRDVTPTRPVKGQTALDLGDEELEGIEVGEGETAEIVQGGLPGLEDIEDVRAKGEVNADELRGEVERASEPTPIRTTNRNGQQPPAPLN